MQKYKYELAVGVFAFLGLVCLAYLTFRLGNLELFADKGYRVYAKFNSAGGLRTGSSVEIAGVKVGEVVDIALDIKEDYRAKVTMRIQDEVRFGDDVIASIKTYGLLGDKYVLLSPGGSEAFLEDGDEISETTPLFDLEGLISKFITPGVDK